MKKIGLISDTHGYLDPKVFQYFAEVDEIWHAGDIGDASVSNQLAAFKPFKAVHGNIDDANLRRQFPSTSALIAKASTSGSRISAVIRGGTTSA